MMETGELPQISVNESFIREEKIPPAPVIVYHQPFREDEAPEIQANIIARINTEGLKAPSENIHNDPWYVTGEVLSRYIPDRFKNLGISGKNHVIYAWPPDEIESRRRARFQLGMRRLEIPKTANCISVEIDPQKTLIGPQVMLPSLGYLETSIKNMEECITTGAENRAMVLDLGLGEELEEGQTRNLPEEDLNRARIFIEEQTPLIEKGARDYWAKIMTYDEYLNRRAEGEKFEDIYPGNKGGFDSIEVFFPEQAVKKIILGENIKPSI